MGRTCSHVDCKANDRKNPLLSFHLFPKDKTRMEKWLSSCNRTSCTAIAMFICSQHFVGGKGPTKQDPDPIPYEKVPMDCSKSSPRILGKKKSRRKVAAKALLMLRDQIQSKPNAGNLWEHIEVVDEMGDVDISSPVAVDSASLLELKSRVPKCVSCKRLKPTTQQSNRKAVFQPNQYPWGVGDMNLPSPKRLRQLVNNKDCQGCEVLSFDVHKDQLEHMSEKIEDVQLLLENAIASPAQRTLDLCYDNSLFKEINTNTQATTPTHHSVAIQCDLGTARGGFSRYSEEMSDKGFQFFTGVSKSNFELIYNFIGGDKMCYNLKYEYSRNISSLKKKIRSDFLPRDRFFMTLARLRRGVPIRHLAYVFNISVAHVSNIFFTWVRFLSLSFQGLKRNMFTSTEKQQKSKCKGFKLFQNLRAIIDSIEINIQKPEHFDKQGNTYFNFKNSHTVKFLVGISHLGLFCFVSEGYEGSTSNRQIVLQSGFLKHLKPHDAIIADRGFDIGGDLKNLDVDLIIPPFLGDKKKLTVRETVIAKALAKIRVLVERAIGRIRNFRLLRGTVPNTLVPILSDLIFVCCCLVNFQQGCYKSVKSVNSGKCQLKGFPKSQENVCEIGLGKGPGRPLVGED